MNRWLIAFITLATSSLLAQTKVVYKDANYTLATSDVDSLIVFTGSKPISVSITAPPANRTQYRTGVTIQFAALMDHPVTMVPRSGVTLISRDDSMKSSAYGSRWEIIHLGRNVWLLSGDMVTTEYDGYLGDSIVLKARVDPTATGPFTFVWRKNGDIVQGATNASLGIPSLKVSDAGIYLVTVSNSAGIVTSEVLTLNVR